MNTHAIYRAIGLLSALGVLLAVYLLYQQIFLPDFRPCTINSWINCDAVITGPVAKTFGIPTPIFGLVGYIGIFFAAMFRKTKFLVGLSSFGLAFCLWIAYQELIILRVICPICIMCQTIMISVFSMSILVTRRLLYETKK